MSQALPSLVATAAILAAFVVMSWQRKWIADDGYIYLAYVQNFTGNDVGPVFNTGERVEAFTSTGWFIILSAANLLRPDRLLTMRQMTLLVSMMLSTAAVALWPLVERQARRTLGHGRGFLTIPIPMAVMAGTYVFQSFATSGLETPLQLLWLMAVLVVVWSEYGSARQALLLAALGGLGPLVRPDLAIVSASMFALFVYVERRRGSRSRFGMGVLLFALPTTIATMIRVAVYGQLVPNTYYAKNDSGLGFSQGFDYLADVVVVYHPEWIVVLAVILALAPLRSRHRTPGNDERPEHGRHIGASKRRAWLLVTAGIHAVYVLSIGGDFMHGRFWITAWILSLGAIAGLGLHRSDEPTVASKRLTAIGAVAPIAVLVLCTTLSSRQSDLPDGTFEIIDGIADEALVYASGNPNLYHWSGDNLHHWAQTGRVARELAILLDTEIGLAQIGIGQVTFEAQRDHGDVYIFDLFGLTQQAGARNEGPTTEDRVGHSKLASEALVLLQPRVDFYRARFPGYNEAFAVDYRGESFMLVNLDLIPDLRSAGVISDVEVDRMRGYIIDTLESDQVDRNFLTFLAARYHRNDDIRARIDVLRDEAARSQWATWFEENGTSLRLLDNTGCSVPCFGLAIERHLAEPIPYLLSEPNLIEVPR